MSSSSCVWGLIGIVCSCSVMADEPKPQYQSEGITVPFASADEVKREGVSVELASQYLEQGAKAWSQSRNCISCHTNGSYLQIRPALTPLLGKPSEEIRDYFVDQLEVFEKLDPEKRQVSTTPAQIIYLAAGLSEWDAHVTQQLSPETSRALQLMFSTQRDNGTWGSLDCWPPFESDAYHLATVAGMAAGIAPGWLKGEHDAQTTEGLARLRKYLQTEQPPHDYSRLLLLWVSSRIPDLLEPEQKMKFIEMVREHQLADGGWSIRSFAAPEAWGKGNRAERLRSEPDLASPASDGHLTGLALLVLLENGVEKNDPAIAKGVQWLKQNQRASGRWWTKSLNTDSWHFITYSGTCYSLLALSKADGLSVPVTKRSTPPE